MPALLVLTLVALVTSITAVGVFTALLAAATLLRLLDPELHARFRVPLAVPIAAYVVASLLATAFARDRGAALHQSKDLLHIVLFVAAVNGFRSTEQIRRAFAWFFAAVGVASVYAILQSWACNGSTEPPAWVATVLRVRFDRCRNLAEEPFRVRGFFSIYMTFGGTLIVALALLAGGLALGVWRRAAALVLPTVLALVAIGLTYSRNAWVGLLAAVGTLVVLTRRLLLIVPLAVILLLAVAVPSPLRARIESAFDPANRTVSERLYFWESGLHMVRDAPFLGLGPGGVKIYYPEYKNPAARRTGTSHLHNDALQIAAERGLLGLAAWLSIWIVFLYRAVRIYRALPPGRSDAAALVAGGIAGVVGFLAAGLFEYNFGDSEVIGLVWVVMAVPFVVAREAGAPVVF
ncbi:MAG TPA: O-antigen ligase family protein [Methylomirabilota bacterium]